MDGPLAQERRGDFRGAQVFQPVEGGLLKTAGNAGLQKISQGLDVLFDRRGGSARKTVLTRQERDRCFANVHRESLIDGESPRFSASGANAEPGGASFLIGFDRIGGSRLIFALQGVQQ